MEYKNEFEQREETMTQSGYDSWENPGSSSAPWTVNEEPPKKGNGLAIAALVLGIIGMVLACCFPWGTLVLSLIGLILGIVSLVKKCQGKGMAVAGTILSGVSLLIAIVIVVLAIVGVNIMNSAYEEGVYDELYEYNEMYDYEDMTDEEYQELYEELYEEMF